MLNILALFRHRRPPRRRPNTGNGGWSDAGPAALAGPAMAVRGQAAKPSPTGPRRRPEQGAGVREANHILSVRGQVLPSTLDHIYLVAEHEDGTKTTGQAMIAKTEKRIKRLELKPKPDRVAEDIVKAIEEADLIVLGPGSLYTSVLPNLLIEGVASALSRAKARKVFVANIMTYEGETHGYDLPDLLRAIDEHTYPFRVYDTVLVNNGPIEVSKNAHIMAQGSDGKVWVVNDRTARLVQFDAPAYQNKPFRVVEGDIVNPAYPIRHDTGKLAKALMGLLKEG